MAPSEDQILSQALDLVEDYSMANLAEETEDDLQLSQVADSIEAAIDVFDMLDLGSPFMLTATRTKPRDQVQAWMQVKYWLFMTVIADSISENHMSGPVNPLHTVMANTHSLKWKCL